MFPLLYVVFKIVPKQIKILQPEISKSTWACGRLIGELKCSISNSGRRSVASALLHLLRRHMEENGDKSTHPTAAGKLSWQQNGWTAQGRRERVRERASNGLNHHTLRRRRNRPHLCILKVQLLKNLHSSWFFFPLQLTAEPFHPRIVWRHCAHSPPTSPPVPVWQLPLKDFKKCGRRLSN